MYTEDSHIETIEDVRAFFTLVVERVGDEWHPDDEYSCYKDPKTKESIFTPEETALYNRLQKECFDICDAKDEDIYDLGWEVIEKFLNL